MIISNTPENEFIFLNYINSMHVLFVMSGIETLLYAINFLCANIIITFKLRTVAVTTPDRSM